MKKMLLRLLFIVWFVPALVTSIPTLALLVCLFGDKTINEAYSEYFHFYVDVIDKGE